MPPEIGFTVSGEVQPPRLHRTYNYIGGMTAATDALFPLFGAPNPLALFLSPGLGWGVAPPPRARAPPTVAGAIGEAESTPRQSGAQKGSRIHLVLGQQPRPCIRSGEGGIKAQSRIWEPI